MADRAQMMRNIGVFLALGVSLTSLTAGLAQDNPSPDVVTVPDAALRTVLEDRLGLAEGAPITAAALAELTKLEARDRGIVDLTGLEHATGLTLLDVGPGAVTRDPWTNSNDVSDLSPLSGLTALTWLDLAGNSVEDVTPLSGLTRLAVLIVEVNKIQDMRSLSGLTKLRELYMAYNLIPSLELGQWLPRMEWPGAVIYPLFSGSALWPTLDGSLNRLVMSYKEALRWGRTTDEIDPSRCFSRIPISDDWDESKPAFYAWDPSKPPHSVPVRIRLLQTEESIDIENSIDKVIRFLEGHCITRVRIGRPSSEDADWVRTTVYACVPVPLLVPLSELPSVARVRRPTQGDFPQTSTGSENGDSGVGGQDGCGSDLPGTGVEGSSWGAIKSLFR